MSAKTLNGTDKTADGSCSVKLPEVGRPNILSQVYIEMVEDNRLKRNLAKALVLHVACPLTI